GRRGVVGRRPALAPEEVPGEEPQHERHEADEEDEEPEHDARGEGRQGRGRSAGLAPASDMSTGPSGQRFSPEAGMRLLPKPWAARYSTPGAAVPFGFSGPSVGRRRAGEKGRPGRA